MIITPTPGFKVAFPTDEHFPYQDELARNLALQIVQDFRPNLMVCGSDGMDFYAVSSFDKDPKRQFGLQAEINAWKNGMREWASAAPNAVRAFIPGNHEDRLRRYIWRHPEMSGLDAVQLFNLLDLDGLGVLYDENVLGENYGQSELEVGPLVIKHGTLVRKYSGYSARGELEKEYHNVDTLFTGHTHRGGMHLAQTRGGLKRAFECFCLCDLNPPYVNRPDWHHGLVLATIYGTIVQVETIPFIQMGPEKHAYWRDRTYTGR
jgi:hypothetical protein